VNVWWVRGRSGVDAGAECGGGGHSSRELDWWACRSCKTWLGFHCCVVGGRWKWVGLDLWVSEVEETFQCLLGTVVENQQQVPRHGCPVSETLMGS